MGLRRHGNFESALEDGNSHSVGCPGFGLIDFMTLTIRPGRTSVHESPERQSSRMVALRARPNSVGCLGMGEDKQIIHHNPPISRQSVISLVVELMRGDEHQLPFGV